MGHSRSHVIAQRERHKRRASRKLALADEPHKPPHKARLVLRYVYGRCWTQECLGAKRRADRDADNHDFEEALQWQADTRALTR